MRAPLKETKDETESISVPRRGMAPPINRKHETQKSETSMEKKEINIVKVKKDNLNPL